MKLLILFLLSINVSWANMDCYEKLTRGFGDSAHFKQYSGDVLSNGMERMDEQMATNSVNLTLKQLECVERVKVEHMLCENTLSTVICRINTRMGYFIILKDYVDTVNIIFNRWD
jgi:hypothetical protein